MANKIIGGVVAVIVAYIAIVALKSGGAFEETDDRTLQEYFKQGGVVACEDTAGKGKFTVESEKFIAKRGGYKIVEGGFGKAGEFHPFEECKRITDIKDEK